MAGDMTENIAGLIEEAILERMVPPPFSEGWRTVMLWDAMLEICHSVVGQVMVGPTIGNSPEYLLHAIGYTETVTSWSGSMFMLPSWLRKPYFYISRGGRTVRSHLQETKNLVIPELRRSDKIENKEKLKKDSSMIEALLRLAPGEDQEIKYDEVVNQMLILTFAAAGMWNMILCQVIYYYMAYPQHAKDLCAEVEKARREHGGWTKEALLAMPKLDSFVREVLRCSPPIIYRRKLDTIQRKVMQEVHLSNNTILTPGQMVMIPTRSILHDESIYPSPSTFDPYRFYDSKEDKVKILSVTQTTEFPV
ncbi:hypothetical protein NHQ30_007464 [Ciborinia camelliae]|nr:hypothetical protein NHQ30_007464 [Ciborinia camelliae]